MALHPQLTAMIDSLAADIRPAVQQIEQSPMLHRDHYANYLNIISQADTEMKRLLMANALIKAGANRNGVQTALVLLGITRA